MLLALLTGDIVVPVGPPLGREMTLVLLFEVFTCCCFGGLAVFVTTVVVVCCFDGDDDDTADVGGVTTDDAKGDFSVFAIPHMRDSVVLITLRSGLLGSHIFALSSDDIGLLSEVLPLPPSGGLVSYYDLQERLTSTGKLDAGESVLMIDHMERTGKIQKTGDYNVYRISKQVTTKEDEDWVNMR